MNQDQYQQEIQQKNTESVEIEQNPEFINAMMPLNLHKTPIATISENSPDSQRYQLNTQDTGVILSYGNNSPSNPESSKKNQSCFFFSVNTKLQQLDSILEQENIPNHSHPKPIEYNSSLNTEEIKKLDQLNNSIRVHNLSSDFNGDYLSNQDIQISSSSNLLTEEIDEGPIIEIRNFYPNSNNLRFIDYKNYPIFQRNINFQQNMQSQDTQYKRQLLRRQALREIISEFKKNNE